MLDWARQSLAGADTTTFSGLLTRASDEGLDTDERLCLAYLVIAAFHPRDDRLGVRVRVLGRPRVQIQRSGFQSWRLPPSSPTRDSTRKP